MKTILVARDVIVPEGVTVTIKARKVTVTGKRGMLQRSFMHDKLDMQLVDGGKKIHVELWFGKRKAIAGIRTITSHITNMITGVTKGFERKMRLVYAHFPISVTIEGNTVELRNFLGEKVVRSVRLLEGVSCTKSDDVKDELVLKGNDVELVAQSAAAIQQKCLVRNKDIRKFLDGAYVSSKGFAEMQ